MTNQNVPIRKGPDRWLLAESLFHEEDFTENGTPLSFTVEHEGKEYRVLLHTISIAKSGSREGYVIQGIANVRSANRVGTMVLEHVPVKLSYSVKTRTGTASVNF